MYKQRAGYSRKGHVRSQIWVSLRIGATKLQTQYQGTDQMQEVVYHLEAARID